MRCIALCLLGLLSAAPAKAYEDSPSADLSKPAPDPSKKEVPLPCEAPDWEARLIVDNGETGVWTVESFNVFSQYGSPEVVGLDDKGHCIVCVSYSGKWTPLRRVADGKWLGGLSHGDIDPRIEGAELYTGGQNGNLYQLVPFSNGALDARRIGTFPGKEIHTLVSGDLDPRSDGAELLVFTRPGALYRVSPTGKHGTFEAELLEVLPGRVRNALVVPDGKTVITTGRDGAVRRLRIGAQGPEWQELHRETMGSGRLTLAPSKVAGRTVFYSTWDDGRVLRHEEGEDGWATELVYLGPQGPRGLAAGRFDAAGRETLAVFGYSGRVELLTRSEEGWSVETLFVDRDKGHWLAAAELDGRNGTQELIASGYGGRIVMLTRPVGHGLDGVPIDPDPPVYEESESEEHAQLIDRGPAPLRLAVSASEVATEELSTLRYGGGFVTKTAVYETLVRRDDQGRIVPALAEDWTLLDGGRRVRFELRKGARFHDGSPVSAEDVVQHFRRWVGLPEHAWLGASERIEEVTVLGPTTFGIELDRPYALLPDLCAINPCGIRAPSSLDGEGEFVQPVGSGPWRWKGITRNGAGLAFASLDRTRPGLEMVRFEDPDPRAVWRALTEGRLDLAVESWGLELPRPLPVIEGGAPGLDLLEAPGSCVVYLSFRLTAGPTSSLSTRRHVQGAIHREQLVRAAEGGCADPCWSWAAPGLSVWPRGARSTGRKGSLASPIDLTLLVDAGADWQTRVAEVLLLQLDSAGFRVEVAALPSAEVARAVEEGRFDLRLERTWGLPYDPSISLAARFLPPTDRPSAARSRDYGVDPVVRELVEASTREPTQEGRSEAYARIQERMDEHASIVPLFVPRRRAVRRVGGPGVLLGPDLYRVDLELGSGM